MSKTPEPYRSAILDELLKQITPKEQEKVAIKMRIAVRIADRLEELRMQKKELAGQCDLKGSSMVTKWLSGGHNFTVDTLVDIAYALGLSVADLVRPAGQRVFFARTLTIQVPAQSNERRTIQMDDASFIARASNAIGTTTMVSEPLYLYGQKQTCLA